MTAPIIKLCVITGYVGDCQGNPCAATTLVFTCPSRLPDIPQPDQNILLKSCVLESITDANGKFEVSLPQGAWFLVTNTELALNHEYQVPCVDTVDFNKIVGFWRREKYESGDPIRISSGEWYSESV